MGRKLVLLGCAALVAAACGDSMSNGTPTAGSGGQAPGAGGKAGGGTSAGTSDAGGEMTQGGTADGAGAASAAGEASQGGTGPDGEAGAGMDQAGVGPASSGGESAGGDGGAGPSGMAGEASSSAGSPGEAGAPGCVDSTPRFIAGSLDGEEVHSLAFAGGAFSRAEPEVFDLRARLGTDGVLHIWGPNRLYSIGDDSPIQGHLLLPSEDPNGGVHYCAESGSATRVSTFRHTATLSDWTQLGACPSAGAGTLSGCFEQTSNGAVVACSSGQVRLVGSVGNTDIDASYLAGTTNSSGANSAPNPATVFLMFGDGGMLMMRTVANDGSGYLRLPDDGPLPGHIVCIGAGSIVASQLSHRYTFTLSSLGAVGACPGASSVGGQIDGCL